MTNFKIGDKVRVTPNKGLLTLGGDTGTVDSVNLGPGLGKFVLVRFHDETGKPRGEGLCMPKSGLVLIS
jgi:hypothetical protein